MLHSSSNTTRSLVTNDENNPDSLRLRQSFLTLGSSLETWASQLGNEVMPAPELKRPSTHANLSRYLDTTIYDVSSFGSVPALIDHKIKVSEHHQESFLVTDLTCVVEQFDQW